MPQVPYSGAPQVSPQDNPIPRYVANATPDAFGVNVANAIQGVGRALDSAGNEMFARGLAMQELYNQSQAQEADVKYMKAAGDINDKLQSMSGKNAVEYYQKGFYEDLTTARKAIRDSLPNDMARRMYDSSTLRTTGQTLFNGARHSGSENKKYAIGAGEAKIGAVGDQILSNPMDEAGFKNGIAEAERQVDALGAISGMSQDEIDLTKQRKVSDLWAKRIEGIAKQDPPGAQKMLDEASKNGVLKGEALGKVTNTVTTAMRTVGSRQISQQVNEGADGRWGDGQVSMTQAKAGISWVESRGAADPYRLQGPQTARYGRALGKYQVMEKLLPEFLREAGMAPMSKEEFLNSPEAQEKLFESRFGGYMQKYGSFNEAASRWFTGRSLAEARAANANDATATTKGTHINDYIKLANAGMARVATEREKVEMGQRIAKEIAPNDPLMPDFTRDRITADHNKEVQLRRDEQFNYRQKIEGALVSDTADGKLATTVEELTADPEVKTAWDNLNPDRQRYYLGVLAKNAKGVSVNWTQERLKNYQSFKGMAWREPEKFLEQDITSLDLPTSAQRELINLQENVRKSGVQDPRMTRAMAAMEQMLDAAGIKYKAGSDNKDYYQFAGAYEDALKQFVEEKKRQPSAEEARQIGGRLLRDTPVPRMWGLYTGSDYLYRLPVPTTDRGQIEDALKRAGVPPTDENIQRIYTKSQYQKLFGSSVVKDDKPAAAPKSATPAPPVSQ